MHDDCFDPCDHCGNCIANPFSSFCSYNCELQYKKVEKEIDKEIVAMYTDHGGEG